MLTPYQFASNNPIRCIDLDGAEGSADLDVYDPNVQLMHQWSQEDGSGGTLLNNVYYNSFCTARATAFAAGAAMAGAVIVAVYAYPIVVAAGTATVSYMSTPQGQQTAVEAVGFVANVFNEGPEIQTPGPGDELGKLVNRFFNGSGKAVANLFEGGFEFVAKNANFYGGNRIITTAYKTTTVIGRSSDISFVRATGTFTQGQNNGGLNVLSVRNFDEIVAQPNGGKAFWETFNKPWLDDAIARGDNIRILSDPLDPANLYRNGIDGERTFFGMEIQYLEQKGYTFANGEAIAPQQ